MTDITQYLAEEVGIDHRDGHLTRREALHRLTLLGLNATAAMTLLSACGNASKPAPTAAPSSLPPGTAAAGGTAAAPPAVPANTTEGIVFAGPDGRKLQGAWSKAEKPRGAVLVIHENKGLTDHHRQVAGRFAAAGYSALAIDLLSEEGGTASLGDVANATAALAKIPAERFVADLRAGLDELAKRVPSVKLGAIGFCFGGGMAWRLAASKDPRLAAVAPFYGPLPEGADFSGAKAAVLGVFAEKDDRVNASRDAAKAALLKAGLTHEIVTYPGVDHAFFNDTGPRYDAVAATEAWTKVLAWFGKHVG